MEKMLGFWSYVHADDNTDGGRVAQLARDVVSNYEALGGSPLELVLDKDALHWGDRWRERLDAALSGVAFFIPVVTPRYFTSPECRRELEFFLTRAEKLGLQELLMPLLYIDVAALHAESPTDPLIKSIAEWQWVDWRDLRYAERSSEAYRRHVSELAGELAQRVQASESVDVIPAVTEDQSPGLVDRVAALEEALPRLTQTLEDFKGELEEITRITVAGSESLQKASNQGKAFAARLTTLKLMSQELAAPVENVERLAQQFASDLGEVDAGIVTLLDLGSEQVDAEDGVSVEEFHSFLNGVLSMSRSTAEGLGSIQTMINTIQPVEGMSRDMRQPMRRLREALVSMVQAQEITDSWATRIESGAYGLNLN